MLKGDAVEGSLSYLLGLSLTTISNKSGLAMVTGARGWQAAAGSSTGPSAANPRQTCALGRRQLSLGDVGPKHIQGALMLCLPHKTPVPFTSVHKRGGRPRKLGKPLKTIENY